MSKAEKLLGKMRNNPRDWKIEDIKAIANRYEIDMALSIASLALAM